MMVHFSISCCSLVFDGKSESEHLMVYCRLFYILVFYGPIRVEASSTLRAASCCGAGGSG